MLVVSKLPEWKKNETLASINFLEFYKDTEYNYAEKWSLPVNDYKFPINFKKYNL